MKALHCLSGVIGILNDTSKGLSKAKANSEEISQLKIIWAQKILKRLNFDLEVIGIPSLEPSLLFIGNHISYMDVPLLMSSIKNISFVAKKELKNWPIFGHGAVMLDTVFVNRENNQSRNSARLAIHDALTNKKRIVVFPSGTTCIDDSKPWRKGAFAIAQESGSMIQPFRIQYEPLRKVAFIDNDFFISHLYELLGESKIKAKLEFHDPVQIENSINDCQKWKEWSRFNN